MQEITLRSRTGPIENAIYLIFFVGSLGVSIYGLLRNNLSASFSALIAVAIFRAWRSAQGNKQVGIDQYGVTVRTSHLDVTVIPWPEIEAIAVTDVGAYTGRGYYSYRGQYLGIRLTPRSNLKDTEECSENRRLCAYDILLSDSFGMSLKEMETLVLNAQRSARGS